MHHLIILLNVFMYYPGMNRHIHVYELANLNPFLIIQTTDQ